MGFKGKGSKKKAKSGVIFKKGHSPLYRKSSGAGLSENIKKTVKSGFYYISRVYLKGVVTL